MFLEFKKINIAAIGIAMQSLMAQQIRCAVWSGAPMTQGTFLEGIQPEEKIIIRRKGSFSDEVIAVKHRRRLEERHHAEDRLHAGLDV